MRTHVKPCRTQNQWTETHRARACGFQSKRKLINEAGSAAYNGLICKAMTQLTRPPAGSSQLIQQVESQLPALWQKHLDASAFTTVADYTIQKTRKIPITWPSCFTTMP